MASAFRAAAASPNNFRSLIETGQQITEALREEAVARAIAAIEDDD